MGDRVKYNIYKKGPEFQNVKIQAFFIGIIQRKVVLLCPII